MPLVLAACGGGGGGSTPISPLNPGVDLSGTYDLTLTVSTANGSCPDPVGTTFTRPMTLAHDTATGVVTIDGGTPDAIRGTLQGTRITLTYVVPVPSLEFSTTITFTSSGSGFNGTYSSRDVGVANPCAETGTAQGTKRPAVPQLNPSVDLTGPYQLTTTVSAATGSCPDPVGTQQTRTINVEHDTAAGTILIDANTPQAVTGTLNGAVVTLARAVPITGENYSATLTFAPDGSTFAGSVDIAETGVTNPCVETVAVSALRAPFNPLSVELAWSSNADLDLVAVEPDATFVTFLQPLSPSGGVHSGDRNTCALPGDVPAESIVWQAAPTGTYLFTVRDFDDCGGASTQFTLTIRYQGTVISTETRTVSASGVESFPLTLQ